MHLVSSDCHKMGIHLPLELCSYLHRSAFPWKAKAITINQRMLQTSSQQDTSNDLIHLCIKQIFKVLLPMLPLVHQKASPSRAVSSCLQRTTDTSWNTLELWKANPIAISSSFHISLPCSLLQKAFAWIVCFLKKILNSFYMKKSGPPWKWCHQTFQLHQLKSVQRVSAPEKG